MPGSGLPLSTPAKCVRKSVSSSTISIVSASSEPTTGIEASSGSSGILARSLRQAPDVAPAHFATSKLFYFTTMNLAVPRRDSTVMATSSPYRCICKSARDFPRCMLRRTTSSINPGITGSRNCNSFLAWACSKPRHAPIRRKLLPPTRPAANRPPDKGLARVGDVS